MSEGHKPEQGAELTDELDWEQEQELAQRMAEEEEQAEEDRREPAQTEAPDLSSDSIPEEEQDVIDAPFLSLLNDEELTQELERLCRSKAEELKMLGYEQVTGVDVWNCIAAKYKKGMPPLYELVNAILSLKPSAFMNWLMINAYKS